MHDWGSDFKYFEDVSDAAYEIGSFCRFWGRIAVTQTKEKYGTARVYCSMGIHQLFNITHPGYAFNRYPKWLWKLDCTVISRIFSLLHINNLVIPYQQFIYRLAYKKTIAKYTHIRKEILACADFDDLLKGL